MPASPHAHHAVPHVAVWLRQDLRAADNTALLAACADTRTRVTALYAITPGQWQQHDVAGVRIDFELRQLACLRDELAALNIPLCLLEADDYAALVPVLARWADAHGVTTLHANRQYEINEQARDRAVASALQAQDIDTHWHEDLCIVPPGRVLTGDRRFYTVFTPFRRNWQQQLDDHGTRPRGLPAQREAMADGVSASPLPEHIAGYPSHVDAGVAQALWPAGEAHAHDRLAGFIAEAGGDYDRRRDLPAIDGTSTLSPYLAAGVLSARQCLHAARRQLAHARDARGLDTWIGELCWRDFYKHILVGFPHVCRHQAFKRETDAIAWRHDDALFRAWCEGRTGYPVVDAAMRQLLETGWMHNRLRMISAMFLSKDLFIDWRLGERHFMRHLIDGDLSANNGGWQWSASTGNDAAPYFRVFNPTLQGRKFDPDGEFIRRFLPALAGLDARRVHEPHAKQVDALLDYPLPVVDHGEARLHAIAAFRALAPAGSGEAPG